MVYQFGRSRQLATVAAAVAIAFAPFAPAAAQHSLIFTSASKVAIEGTSNVHKWTCATESVTGNVTSSTSATSEVGKTVTAMTVSIPVKSLDCGNGGMTDNLRKTMHEGSQPTIRFRMTSYDAIPHGEAYDAVVHGVMTINGVDRPVDLRATITPNGSGGASVVGSTPINTEDYGVKRVKLFMGTLRTSADVTITFRLTAVRG